MKILKWFLAVVLLALGGCSTYRGGTTDDYDTVHGSRGSSPNDPISDPLRRDFPNTAPASGLPDR